MRKIMGLAVVLAITVVSGARADPTFTAANGPKCKEESKAEFNLWTCPGPAGYAVSFADEGNMVSLTLAPSSLIENARPTAQWRGATKAFGDKVQWIMRGGVPRAAVIRTWRRSDDDEREIHELSVFAIDSGRACSYGAVDIHQKKANEVALAKAEEAAASRCPEK